MKLTYRGVNYDYNPPVLDVTQSEAACQYRGQSATVNYVRHVPITQPAEQLTYRGVAYQTTRKGEVLQLVGQPAVQGQQLASNEATARPKARQTSVFQALRKLAGDSPAASARRELLKEATQVHKQSISRALEHRIEVARAEGNERLLRQLEAEMRQTA